MIRLFGIEFSPLRTDTTCPLGNMKETGYELGVRVGLEASQNLLPYTKELFNAMGVDPNSLAANDFSERLKFGEHQSHDFIRDYLAGYEYSISVKADARHSFEKAKVLLRNLKSRGDFALMNKGEYKDAIEEAFGKDCFPMTYCNLPAVEVPVARAGSDSAALKLAAMRNKVPANIALLGNFTFEGGEFRLDGEPLTIETDQNFTEETYRCISRVFERVINPVLLDTLDSIMFEEWRDSRYELLQKETDRLARNFGLEKINNVYM